MGLIVHQGTVQHSPSFEMLEQYGFTERTKVQSVRLWSFERLTVGFLSVRWGNGAIGSFVSPNLREIQQHVLSLKGWPQPHLYNRSLSFEAGRALMPDSPDTKLLQETQETQDAGGNLVREPQREVRRRRTRAGTLQGSSAV